MKQIFLGGHMTVKELRDKLYRFEDNFPVYIAKAHKPEPQKKIM